MLLRSFGLIAATLTLLLAPPAFGAKFADGTIVERVTSTATAAGTTTLTVSSTRYQRFTGSSTQTVVLPDATTLRTGITFSIMNESSGNVTVQYADASTAVVLTGGQSAELFLASNGSSNGTWNIRRPATLTSTETLTNKTLTSPTINTPTLNGSGGQLTLPAGPDTLVGKATTDTLTNKTIDADGTGNSITNIENADIKAGAAIARDKLASGTASHVVINDGTGVMSSEASLSISRGGTGQATATAGFDALAPTTTKGDLIVSNGTDNIRLAVGSDGQALVADSGEAAGVKWAAASGGGQGGINYLAPSSTTNSDLETSVGDWLAYADAAGTQPVDGNGGSPTLTCTRTTSSPLRGTGSLLITKDAANRQGEGCAAPFTIDRADLAKPLMVEFDYEVASGTYDVGSDTTDPDLTAWVYGPTDGTPVVTQLAPYKVLGGTTGTQMKFQGRFQTASSGVAYRLILHEAKTGTSAYTAKLDNIKVGPEQKSFGPPITDWQSYTPTVAGFGTVSGLEAFYRRVGDSVEIRARWVSGTSTAVGATVTLPTGLSVSSDSSKLGSNPALVGKLTRGAMDTAQVDMTVLAQTGNSYLSLGFRNGSSNAMTVANGDSIASSGEGLTFFATVPVSGWSSTVQMSNDTDTRVVAAKVYLGSNFSVTGSVTDVAFNTVAFDTHGAFNTSTYTYTAPVPGYYRISSFLTWTVGGTSASDVQFLVANSANTTLAMLLRGPSSTTATQQPGSTILHLSAGDTLKFRVFQNSGGTNWQLDAGATNTSVSIERLSGPSAIAATETVAASYNTAAAQSIPNNTATTVVYGTKVVDTHGAFNASTGVYTITSSGKYRVSASINWTANGTGTRRLRIRKNGSDAIGAGVPANASTDGSIVVSGILSCVAGDTIDAQAFQNSGGALTLLNNAYDNVFSIERVGN